MSRKVLAGSPLHDLGKDPVSQDCPQVETFSLELCHRLSPLSVSADSFQVPLHGGGHVQGSELEKTVGSAADLQPTCYSH